MKNRVSWPIFISFLSALSTIGSSLSVVYQLELHYLVIGLFAVSSCLLLYDLWRSLQNSPQPEDIFHLKLAKAKTSTHRDYWLPWLLVGSLPYELLYLLPGPWKYLMLLKSFRSLSIIKHYKSIANLTGQPRFLQLSLIMMGALTAIHLVACTWVAINPITQLPVQSYIQALYWAVTTLTTTGYGDITPTNDLGRLFTVCVMLVGFSSFGIIVGHVSNLLMAKNKHQVANREKVEDLTLFMRHYEIPRDLRTQVFSFYANRLEKRLTDNDTKIIAELPHVLQNELHIFMKMKLIDSIPVFHGLSRDCLKKISRSLESVSFALGQVVINKGDDGEEMYIIDHGEVEILNEENTVVAILRHGQCFGEMALLTHASRKAAVKARSYCDVYKLSKHKFQELSQDYPELEINFRKIMTKRMSDRAA